MSSATTGHVYHSLTGAECPDCGVAVDGKVLVRDDAVRLSCWCPEHGRSEQQIHDDPEAWLEALVTRATGPGEEVLAWSRAVCPSCHELVDAARVRRDGKILLRKRCPDHGTSEALICDDADWYAAALRVSSEGRRPLRFATEQRDGCPQDCGLCPDHEQHTCLPIIEITDRCDLDCPICLVRDAGHGHMSVRDFGRIIQGLVDTEGQVDIVNLSGGEPTLHPDLDALLDLADRPEVGRISISTNGRRLARDPALRRDLARRGVYVNLQFDGLDATATHALRQAHDDPDLKLSLLDALQADGVATTLTCTVARGVNEELLGDGLRLLLERSNVLSLMVQPAAYTGAGGGSFAPHDPMDIVTIPEVARRLAEASDGLLKADDFLPMPCSHPACFALTYLLRTDDGFVPLPRFVDPERYLRLVRNRGTLNPDADFEAQMTATIDDLWCSSGQIPDCDRVLGALKQATTALYPTERSMRPRERIKIGEQHVKSVFIHAFMDDHTFEVERVRKCCHQYALADGRLMPACSFNAFFRPGCGGFADPLRAGG